MLPKQTLLSAILFAALSSSAVLLAQPPASTPYNSVDTRIGTAGGGNTFPGATLPFGMIQWSPDTESGAWYRYPDKSILGFSLAHISGAGCPLYGDFAVLPVTADLTASPNADFTTLAVPFGHQNEETHPGYYSVILSNGVRVELTVTDRAGIARFTFPEGTPARLLINAGSSAQSVNENTAAGRAEAAANLNSITLTGSDAYEATSRAGHFCGSDSHYTIFGAGRFNKPYTQAKLWQDASLLPDAKSAKGRHTGALLDFGNQREIELKVAVSFVGTDGARKNLDREIPQWDFNAVHANAVSTWTTFLNRFSVDGGTQEDRTKFFTGVYHSFLSPNLFSDVDRRYIGFDKTVHTLPAGQHAQYANFSDWDIYRNTIQLQALFEPQRVSDMMQSLVNDAEQGGQLPRWAAANDVTYVMGGDSPAPVIASAYAFGARNFDAAAALKYMVKAATETENNRERPFLADYLKLGYVPSDKDRISVSRTLEYTSDDFAAAQLAKSLGRQDVAARFLKLSENWKNLLDPETKFMRPRLSNGSWLEGFDAEKSLPRRPNAPSWEGQTGYEEGNTYQYSFMVPYDYPALFAAMGGEQQVLPRLDHFFTKLRCWGQPCFNIENEPDFVTPYAYAFAGQPWKTQEVVQRIARETFKTAPPDGIPGNDDLGATSGVLVWNALGLYPAVPGVGGFVLGTPAFTKATLKFGDGKTLEITRRGDGAYVHSVTFNNAPNTNNWIAFSQIHAGRNALQFTTQSQPDTQRGTAPGQRPPSFR